MILIIMRTRVRKRIKMEIPAAAQISGPSNWEAISGPSSFKKIGVRGGVIFAGAQLISKSQLSSEKVAWL